MSTAALSIVRCISIIIASLIAIYTINAWRRQAIWKRKFEVSEEVLSLFYQCREILSMIRSPFGLTEEGRTRKRKDNESKEESESLDNAYIFVERYEGKKEPFNRLFALEFRFMAVSEKSLNLHLTI